MHRSLNTAIPAIVRLHLRCRAFPEKPESRGNSHWSLVSLIGCSVSGLVGL